MFSAPSRATAAALYRRVEEESNEFSSRLTTHAANTNMSLNRYVAMKSKMYLHVAPHYGLSFTFIFTNI
jgi:hypothetical protein